MKSNRFYKTYPIPGFLLLTVFFLVPIFITIARAFYTDGAFSLEAVKVAFCTSYNQKIMLFTLYQALVSTLASLIIGLPGAYFMATYKLRGRKLINTAFSIPFVLPPILVVLGFVIFYGNSGFLNKLLVLIFGENQPTLKILYSFPAIILAHAFYNFPIISAVVGNYWENLDYSCEMAARTLGSGRMKVFRTVTLKRLMPSILSAMTLVFLFCFTSFAIILVLGGGPQFTTTEVEIYRLARTSMDITGAASLSIFSLAVSTILLVLYSGLQKKMNRPETFRTSQKKVQRRAKGFGRLIMGLYFFIVLIFILAPIFGIVLRSVLDSASRSSEKTFSLDVYKELFQVGMPALKAVITSVIIGFIASLVSSFAALSICVGIKRKGRIASDVIAMLPLAVSSIMTGLAYLILSKWLNYIPRFALVTLAHMVIALPFSIRTILPMYRRIPKNLEDASLTLGANTSRTFRKIIRPILKPSILTAMMFSFAISLGEMNATLILGNSEMETIPVLMYRLISAYNYQGACALGTILIVVCFAVFFLGEILKRRSHV